MRPNGRGVNGYRPYRRFSIDERLAAVKYDLDRLAERAKAREAAKASEPHVVSEPEEKKS